MSKCKTEEIQDILQRARRFKYCRRKVSHRDYEYFKSLLYEKKLYGFEKDLADALKL